MPYSYKPKGKAGKAQGHDINASFKDLSEVCRNIRGRNAYSARDFLELAAKGERAIYFGSHNKGMGHRHELGGRKGGWPVKSAKIVLGILENAIANAEKNGISVPIVKHAAANKQDIYPRLAPKGRRFKMDYETARVAIVLEEAILPKGAAPKAHEKKEAPKKEAVKQEARQKQAAPQKMTV